jgi:hypothetical protein
VSTLLSSPAPGFVLPPFVTYKKPQLPPEEALARHPSLLLPLSGSLSHLAQNPSSGRRFVPPFLATPCSTEDSRSFASLPGASPLKESSRCSLHHCQ